MDIHKPKPIRNWREFLKEVGIIVLGVSIALAAEQAVEWFHWQSEVVKANEAIATELSYNLQGAIYRLRLETCLEARLDTLSTILDSAVKTGSLPPLGEIGRSPPRLWRSGVWEGVISSQVVTHFSRERQSDLATTYKVVDRLAANGPEERNAWDDLYAMVGPGRRIDPYAENLRRVLSRARSDNRIATGLSAQLIARVHDLGLPFSQDDLARIASARSEPLTDNMLPMWNVNSRVLVCAPIGPVPSTYGQGQTGGMPALMDKVVKTIPDFSGGAR
jgi:hypothetical protein